MSTVSEIPTSMEHDSSSDRLRQSFSAMRVSFAWLGTRKSLSSDQRSQAASPFGAEAKFISAGKKLLDTGHPAMKAVNQLKRQITEHWKGNSLPYPESGIRLVRQIDLEGLNDRMAEFQRELDSAVRALELAYDEIKLQARERLGSLYNESDYPLSFIGQFEVAWDFPNVEPPDYLRRLQPEIYSQECDRIRSRFAEAVEMAEQAFVDELSELVSHLSERLAGNEDGKPKIFRDSAVENLTAFFERFQRLNISSNEELDDLVGRARSVVNGVHPQNAPHGYELASASCLTTFRSSKRPGWLDGGSSASTHFAGRGQSMKSLNQTKPMKLYVSQVGDCRSIYDELLDVRFLGQTSITRVSHVEPMEGGDWEANLGPVGGPRLGPFPSRELAIQAEVAWLSVWLLKQGPHFECPAYKEASQ